MQENHSNQQIDTDEPIWRNNKVERKGTEWFLMANRGWKSCHWITDETQQQFETFKDQYQKDQYVLTQPYIMEWIPEITWDWENSREPHRLIPKVTRFYENQDWSNYRDARTLPNPINVFAQFCIHMMKNQDSRWRAILEILDYALHTMKPREPESMLKGEVFNGTIKDDVILYLMDPWDFKTYWETFINHIGREVNLLWTKVLIENLDHDMDYMTAFKIYIHDLLEMTNQRSGENITLRESDIAKIEAITRITFLMREKIIDYSLTTPYYHLFHLQPNNSTIPTSVVHPIIELWYILLHTPTITKRIHRGQFAYDQIMNSPQIMMETATFEGISPIRHEWHHIRIQMTKWDRLQLEMNYQREHHLREYQEKMDHLFDNHLEEEVKTYIYSLEDQPNYLWKQHITIEMILHMQMFARRFINRIHMATSPLKEALEDIANAETPTAPINYAYGFKLEPCNFIARIYNHMSPHADFWEWDRLPVKTQKYFVRQVNKEVQTDWVDSVGNEFIPLCVLLKDKKNPKSTPDSNNNINNNSSTTPGQSNSKSNLKSPNQDSTSACSIQKSPTPQGPQPINQILNTKTIIPIPPLEPDQVTTEIKEEEKEEKTTPTIQEIQEPKEIIIQEVEFPTKELLLPNGNLNDDKLDEILKPLLQPIVKLDSQLDQSHIRHQLFSKLMNQDQQEELNTLKSSIIVNKHRFESQMIRKQEGIHLILRVSKMNPKFQNIDDPIQPLDANQEIETIHQFWLKKKILNILDQGILNMTPQQLDESTNSEVIKNLEEIIFNHTLYPPTDLSYSRKIYQFPESMEETFDNPRTFVPRFRPRTQSENFLLDDILKIILTLADNPSIQQIEKLDRFAKLLTRQLKTHHPNELVYHFVLIIKASRMINQKDLRPIGRIFEDRLEQIWLFQMRDLFHLIVLRRVLMKSKNLAADMRKIKIYFLDELATLVLAINKNVHDNVLEDEAKTFRITQERLIEFLAEVNTQLKKCPVRPLNRIQKEPIFSKTIVESTLTGMSINNDIFPPEIFQSYLKHLIDELWLRNPKKLIPLKDMLKIQMNTLIENEPTLRVANTMEILMNMTITQVTQRLRDRNMSKQEIDEIQHQLIRGMYPTSRSFLLCEMEGKLKIDVDEFPCLTYERSSFKLHYINYHFNSTPTQNMPSKEMEVEAIAAIATFGNEFILKKQSPPEIKYRQEIVLEKILADLSEYMGLDMKNQHAIPFINELSKNLTITQCIESIRKHDMIGVREMLLELESLVSRMWHQKEKNRYKSIMDQYIQEKKFANMIIYRNVFVKAMLDIAKEIPPTLMMQAIIPCYSQEKFIKTKKKIDKKKETQWIMRGIYIDMLERINEGIEETLNSNPFLAKMGGQTFTIEIYHKLILEYGFEIDPYQANHYHKLLVTHMTDHDSPSLICKQFALNFQNILIEGEKKAIEAQKDLSFNWMWTDQINLSLDFQDPTIYLYHHSKDITEEDVQTLLQDLSKNEKTKNLFNQSIIDYLDKRNNRTDEELAQEILEKPAVQNYMENLEGQGLPHAAVIANFGAYKQKSIADLMKLSTPPKPQSPELIIRTPPDSKNIQPSQSTPTSINPTRLEEQMRGNQTTSILIHTSNPSTPGTEICLMNQIENRRLMHAEMKTDPYYYKNYLDYISEITLNPQLPTVFSHIKQVFFDIDGFKLEQYRIELMELDKKSTQPNKHLLHINWNEAEDIKMWSYKMMIFPQILKVSDIRTLRLSKQQMIRIKDTEEMSTEIAQDIYYNSKIKLPNPTKMFTIDCSEIFSFRQNLRRKGCLLIDIVIDPTYNSPTQMISVSWRNLRGKIMMFEIVKEGDATYRLMETLKNEIWT